jgi:hypothetical protein
MNQEQARRCSSTLEDVFTPMGDAVVMVRCSVSAGIPMAYVTGKHYRGPYAIANLTAKEDVVATVYP